MRTIVESVLTNSTRSGVKREWIENSLGVNEGLRYCLLGGRVFVSVYFTPAPPTPLPAPTLCKETSLLGLSQGSKEIHSAGHVALPSSSPSISRWYISKLTLCTAQTSAQVLYPHTHKKKMDSDIQNWVYNRLYLYV